MHKEYKRPAPYSPDFNYLEGMHATERHIKDITKNKPHPGQAQHLGGTASYNKHLEELHYGKGESIKKDLKRVLDYLFYYSKTDHDIYHFLAEDALMHMDQMVADLQDPKEKEHIRYFVECVREYMHWLKANKPYNKEGYYQNQGMEEYENENQRHGQNRDRELNNLYYYDNKNKNADRTKDTNIGYRTNPQDLYQPEDRRRMEYDPQNRNNQPVRRMENYPRERDYANYPNYDEPQDRSNPRYNEQQNRPNQPNQPSKDPNTTPKGTIDL